MSVREALRPIAETDGVLAVQVLTRDGLPVEMIGHGMRADVLAAEAAGMARAATSAAERLMLGEPEQMVVRLPQYVLACVVLERHRLALVVAQGHEEAALAAARGARAAVADALRGRS